MEPKLTLKHQKIKYLKLIYKNLLPNARSKNE